jgi:osmotically-inducible protein OsmY
MLARISSQDQRVSQDVTRRLSSCGVRPPCSVVVSNRDGSITLSGEIEHERQRRSAVRAAQNTAGVKRVVDQLQVISKISHCRQRGLTTPYLQF